jgi:hypothetical protein
VLYVPPFIAQWDSYLLPSLITLPFLLSGSGLTTFCPYNQYPHGVTILCLNNEPAFGHHGRGMSSCNEEVQKILLEHVVWTDCKLYQKYEYKYCTFLPSSKRFLTCWPHHSHTCY